jgi:hypothetical protein
MRAAPAFLTTLLGLTAAAGLAAAELPPGVNLTNSEAFSMMPSVAPLPGGGAAIAWREGSSQDAQIYFSFTRGGGVFAPNRNISNSAGPSYFPSLKISPTGACCVTWRDALTSSGRVMYAEATAPDAEFAPGVLLPNVPPTFFADLAVPKTNRRNVVFDSQFRIYNTRSLDGGVTWREPRPLTRDSTYANVAHVVARGNRFVAVLSEVNAGPRNRMELRVSTNGGGKFAPARVLSQPEQDAGESALALGPKDAVYAVWSRLLGDTEAAPNRLLIWRSGWKRSRYVADGREPSIFVTPAGAVHLAWRSRGEVYYAASTDGGRTFSEPQNVSQSEGGISPHVPGFSHRPSVGVDENGNVYVAWQETLSDTNDEVFVTSFPAGM